MRVVLASIMFSATWLFAADSISSDLAGGRYQEVLRSSEKLLKASPGDPRVWTARGMALAGLGNTRESLASFDAALRTQSAFIPALRAASETAYRNRHRSARSYLQRLLSADPSSEPAHAMTAVLAFEAGDCKSAIFHFELSRNEVLNNEQAASQFGRCLLDANRAQEGAALFEQILARTPSSAAARYNLAVAQMRAGQVSSAVATLGVPVDSLDAESLNLLASAQAAGGQIASAVDTLRLAIGKYPADERNYLDLAGLCQRDGALTTAIEVLDSGLRHQPRSGRLYATRGVVHAQLSETERAEADFEKAALLASDQAFAAAGLSVLFTETGRAGGAANLLRQKLRRSPNDSNLNCLLAEALMRDGALPGGPEFTEAWKALQLAIKGRAGFAQAHVALGKLYLREGKATKAVEELQNALRWEPGNRSALSQLAAAFRKAGRMPEAAEAANRLRRQYEKDIEMDAARQHIYIVTENPVTRPAP